MPVIKVEKRAHVLLIGLNRPEKRNAFNLEMLHSLADAYAELEQDPELRCGLLYAEGDHFTAGLDLAKVAPQVKKGDGLFNPYQVGPLQTLGKERTKPMVIAVKGYCLTIGIELILAADICIAREDTKFGQIEVNRGIIPFGGATIRFPQRCGWGNAMRYLLTGDTFDAGEALRIGLVQELSRKAPLGRALEIAETIATRAPLAVQATLQNARQAVLDGEKAAVAELLPTVRKLMDSEDAAEGLASFLERREANFKGK